ncbi:MAG: WYL domain-containing protein [Clostridia bacterium]|nr:WYL domain-containing protein [Clostridia bacterium]
MAGNKSRILYLVKLFSEETDEDHSLTLNEINDRLEAAGLSAVTRKTLYEDFEQLREYGLEVQSERRGRSSCYFLADRAFELPELKLLVDSVQASRFITERKSRQLIRKLEGLASRHQARELHRQVLITGRVKSMNESIYYNVDKLHAAINQNSQIQFQYFQWDVNKNMVLRHDGALYTVSPWALILDNENYYLVGFEGGRIKHYRVDKMLRIKATGVPREGGEHYHEQDYGSKSVFGMFGGDVVPVTLEAEAWMAGILIDRFGNDLPMIQTEDEKIEVRVNVAVSPQFFGWLVSLGDGIRLTGPKPVVAAMRRLLTDISSHYD